MLFRNLTFATLCSLGMLPAVAQVDPLPPNGKRADGQKPIENVQSPASTMKEQMVPPAERPPGYFRRYDPIIDGPLQLSSDQVKQLRQLEDRYSLEYDRVKRAATPDYHTLDERRFGDLRLILNPEQYDRWQQMDRARLEDLPLNTPHAPPGSPDVPPAPPRP